MITAGPIVLDPLTHYITGPSGRARISPQRAHLLTKLMERDGKSYSYAALLFAVYGDNLPRDALNTVRSQISHLRAALRLVVPYPTIHTIKGAICFSSIDRAALARAYVGECAAP